MIEKSLVFTYDRTADAAYVYLTSPDGERVVARTRVCDIALDMASINIDFDDEGSIIGFEILGASRLLPSVLRHD